MRFVISDELKEELDQYIKDHEKEGPLSIYQLETAVRNLKRNRRAITDPLMGGKRATLDQSIQYFEDLLNERREKLGEEKCDTPSPPTPLAS